MSGNTDNWTEITPEQFEAIGFVDNYGEDEQGNSTGQLALWILRNPPPYIETLSARYLAVVWQIFSCSEQYGEEYFDIRTESEFNNIMKHLNLDLRL